MRNFSICEKYGKKDSRIVIIHRENGGLVSARKAGVKAARGTYIAYVTLQLSVRNLLYHGRQGLAVMIEAVFHHIDAFRIQQAQQGVHTLLTWTAMTGLNRICTSVCTRK